MFDVPYCLHNFKALPKINSAKYGLILSVFAELDSILINTVMFNNSKFE